MINLEKRECTTCGEPIEAHRDFCTVACQEEYLEELEQMVQKMQEEWL